MHKTCDCAGQCGALRGGESRQSVAKCRAGGSASPRCADTPVGDSHTHVARHAKPGRRTRTRIQRSGKPPAGCGSGALGRRVDWADPQILSKPTVRVRFSSRPHLTDGSRRGASHAHMHTRSGSRTEWHCGTTEVCMHANHRATITSPRPGTHVQPPSRDFGRGEGCAGARTCRMERPRSGELSGEFHRALVHARPRGGTGPLSEMWNEGLRQGASRRVWLGRGGRRRLSEGSRTVHSARGSGKGSETRGDLALPVRESDLSAEDCPAAITDA